MTRSRMDILQPGNRLSAGVMRDLARAAEHRREGLQGGSMLGADTVFAPDASRASACLAMIDDDSARPVAEAARYNAALLDSDGDKIQGSSFSVKEMTGNRYVADGTPVQLFPVDGEWGFLRPALKAVVIADLPEDYTTTNVLAGAWNSPEAFYTDDSGIAGNATSRFVGLIHSQRVLGVSRGLAIQGVILDLAATCESLLDVGIDVPGTTNFVLQIRACKVDWDPATVNWTWLAANMTYDAAVFSVNVDVGNPASIIGTTVGVVWTPVHHDGLIPPVSTPGAWALLDACYGFEMRCGLYAPTGVNNKWGFVYTATAGARTLILS